MEQSFKYCADDVHILEEEVEVQKKKASHIDLDKEKVEQGLAKLVLTLIELIRRLMEKQAITRIENESLTDQQIEDLGDTFMKLDDKMEELKETFGLEDEDLNLNLGPLGDLM